MHFIKMVMATAALVAGLASGAPTGEAKEGDIPGWGTMNTTIATNPPLKPRALIYADITELFIFKHIFELRGANWNPSFNNGRELELAIQAVCGKIHSTLFTQKSFFTTAGRGGWDFLITAQLNHNTNSSCLVDFIQPYCPGCDGKDNK